MGILISTFSREQMPRVFSAFGPVLGGSAVLGPIVAGFVIDANIAGWSWRPMFLINIVLGAVGLAAAWRLLPNDVSTSRTPIDAIGAGLLGAAMFGLIYGLIEGSGNGWTISPILAVGIGSAMLVAFGARQRHALNPLIEPSLLTNRGFTSGMILGLGFFAAVNGLAFVVALFFQTALGFGPTKASISLAPLLVGLITASFVARPLICPWPCHSPRWWPGNVLAVVS
jgi:MFS family permease